MQGLWALAAAVAAAYVLAALAPLLGRLAPARGGRWLGWGLAFPMWACPLLIPADRIGLRALAAFLANDVALKVVEFFRRERAIGDREYLWFLVPFPALAVVYPDHKRRLARADKPWPHLVRLVVGTTVVVAAFIVLHLVRDVAVLQASFVLDHALKVALFVPTIEAISHVLYALERLSGFATTPVIHNTFLSRTTAEFWRRYNGRVHEWLLRNVFEPAGGRRAPLRGVVTVFLVSGVFHEVMFGVATAVFDGSQLLFFLLQIPAVLASGPLERFARRAGTPGRIVAHAATILYLAVTSVLFFRGMSRVFPFVYASPPPWP